MSRINTLITERAQVWHRMQEIMRAAETENRELSAEERENWDSAEQRLTQVSEDIERLERMSALDEVDYDGVVDARATSPEPQEDPEARYGEAFRAYLRRGISDVTAEQRQLLMERYEDRAQSTTGAEGGYTIPEGFLQRMTETMQSFGGILSVAEILNTSTGNPLVWPSFDGTAAVGAILDENTQASEQDMAFGQKTMGAYTYSSKLVRVSLQLLQDSAFDLNSFVARQLGLRIGRATAAHLAKGTGSGQPEGLFTNATVGVTGGASADAVITYDNLVDLIHSVDPAYRQSNCRFVLNDSTLGAVRKLKDGNGVPLWQPSIQQGVPSSVLGYPYTIDQGVDDMAVSSTAIGFGDIATAYIVRQVSGGQVLRLAERYADYLQVGFLGFLRLDAKPNDAAAFRVFKNGPAA